MNEFTKEELEYLRWLVADYEEEYPDGATELPKKLQSMIDNYCEHDAGTSDGAGLEQICNLCDKSSNDGWV